MKKSKLLIIIISIIVAIPLIIFAAISIPWLMLYGGIWLSPDPPKPQITSGEFPFELVYSLDGEISTVNDVFVCEYDGIGMNEGVGKYIEWKSYLKSTKEENLVLFEDENKKIICGIGSPNYYMGNTENCDMDTVIPNLVIYEDYGEITSSHALSQEEMESYKIKLISWKFSNPIKNTYK